jgi:hypothetical protein
MSGMSARIFSRLLATSSRVRRTGHKEHTKDTARVVAGLKAAVHNPNVSNEAKENAMKRLEEMGQTADPSPPSQGKSAADEAHERNVLRGYKAATSSPLLACEGVLSC